MRTDLEREREEQRRWRLRPRHARLEVFDRLVEHEFLPEDRQAAGQAASLARVLRHAVATVPYYQDLFERLRLRPEDIRGPDDLRRLPLLDKLSLRRHEKRLRARALPGGEKVFGVFSSSGTTGQPTRVVQTVSSNAMFSYLNQRHCRFFRLDPSKALAYIRVGIDLPRRPGGKVYPDGVTCHLRRWRYLGRFFETGPWFGLAMTTPVEDQIAWLREIRPDYLGAHASWLEHLTYATEGRAPVDGLQALIGIVEQLTEPMRQRIERVFEAPVHQTYGLNEIGLVAARCGAGRYHVHAEHCLVEIVDPDGQPCPPGRTGRIAITALKNPAMPLIRYDADDMAEAVSGPCPCGRTLPAFANLFGRYRRYMALPEGAFALFQAIKRAVNAAPDDLARNLRQYQVHLYRDDRYELRVATNGPLPALFHERVLEAWQAAIGDEARPLAIVEVARIPRGANGKFQDFTSDYLPAPDAAEPEGGADGGTG